MESDPVAIYITDNDPGIKEEVRGKLFAPFFTTKAVAKGSGLGRSVCLSIVVEKHCGKLDCFCEAGGGV